ncbi:MAG: MFS transporter [Kofleriaceae bacterium]
MADAAAPSVWRDPALADFRRLWAAQAVSAFGSRITRTVLPIIAISTLGVAESMVGVLAALQFAPGVVLALFIGGTIDRGHKRRLLIGADVARMLLVCSLAAAWALDALTIGHLIVVGAGVGAATALFGITDNSYLPTLVARARLVDANSRLEATDAIAEIGGPAAAGVLVRVVGAPLTVLVDAVTYLWSIAWLARIRAVERPAPASASAAPARRARDLALGMRVLFGHPTLRPLVLAQMAWAASGGFFMTLYSLYCLRTLQLDEATFGAIIGVGGLGALGGALVAPRLVAAVGLGRGLLVSATVSVGCELLIPLAAGPLPVVVALLVTHQLLGDGFRVAYQIHAVSLRQRLLPDEVLGRANAALHVCTSGLLPIAALVAGGLADAFGTRTAVWVGVLLGLVAPVALWPVRRLRTAELPAA